MQEFYKATSLTPLGVAKNTGFLDYDSQPSLKKNYPSFLFRYKYEDLEVLAPLMWSRFVRFETQIQGKPYKRLNTPSAGNLHPLDLYVQIRGLKGVLSGIYYIDPWEKEFVLIEEISQEGLESFVNLEYKFVGFLFFISLVPFRSVWKYRQRALRYCYLDAGHQIAAIKESAKLLSKENVHHFQLQEQDNLHKILGFRDEEFVCASLGIGDIDKTKTVKEKKEPLIYVAPTDYSSGISEGLSRLFSTQSIEPFVYKCSATKTDTLFHRASARVFLPQSLAKADLLELMQRFCISPLEIQCYTFVLAEEKIKAGLYKDGKLIKEGDFSKQLVSLLVDQRFIQRSALITFFCAKEFSVTLLAQAGAYMHHISLFTEEKGLGLSPLGAFYDAKVQEFIGTDSFILYAAALGKRGE